MLYRNNMMARIVSDGHHRPDMALYKLTEAIEE